MTDDIEYTTLDSTDWRDIREGDRVTVTNRDWSGPHPVTSIVEDISPEPAFTLGGWAHTPDTATIHRIERPVPRVVEEVGVVYGSPTDPTARVMCLSVDSLLRWIAADASPGYRWPTTEGVRKLIAEHGYVRVDVPPQAGGEQS